MRVQIWLVNNTVFSGGINVASLKSCFPQKSTYLADCDPRLQELNLNLNQEGARAHGEFPPHGLAAKLKGDFFCQRPSCASRLRAAWLGLAHRFQRWPHFVRADAALHRAGVWR